MTINPRGHAVRIMAAFALHASVVGGLFLRLPEIQLHLGLSEATYGLVLLGMPVGVVLGSIMVAPLIQGRGPRQVLVWGLPMTAAAQILCALSPSGPALAVSLFLLGVAFSTGNVAINVEADRFETAHSGRIMSRCHGWWAVGFLVTTLVATLLVREAIAPLTQFVWHTVLLTLAAAAVLGRMPVSANGGDTGPARRFAVPGPAILAIGAFAAAGVLMEGATRGWAVIYARDTFGATDWVAALALPAVVATQTAGRFAGDRLVALYGTVRTARGFAVILFLGILAVVAAPTLPLLMAGLLLIGAGMSTVQPQAFAASARAPGRPAAENVAAYSTISTLIGFVGPSAFGALAEEIGLRATFALALPLPILAIWFASSLLPSRTAGQG